MPPRVSPDGRRVAFASNRGNDEGDFDIWLMRLFDKNTPDEAGGRGPAIRFARVADTRDIRPGRLWNAAGVLRGP